MDTSDESPALHAPKSVTGHDRRRLQDSLLTAISQQAYPEAAAKRSCPRTASSWSFS